MPDHNIINTYLYFGYLPYLADFKWMEGFEIIPENFKYTTEEASSLLIKCFEDSIMSYSRMNYCFIPLSGGWDSRILLGLALKYFDKSKIKTITFGCPGQLDYDIGIDVAKHCEVESINIDLNNLLLEWGPLRDSTMNSPWTFTPDTFYNQYAIKKFTGKNDLVLSGFFGDPLTGGHIHKNQSLSISIEKFLKNQSRAKYSNLTSSKYDPYKSIPKLIDSSAFNPAMLLDFGVRQSVCIAPIVTPLKKLIDFKPYAGQYPSGASCITPFVNKSWMNFWVSAPIVAKKNQSLYLHSSKQLFPKLTNLPSKNSYGIKDRKLPLILTKKFIYKGSNFAHMKFPKIFPKNIVRLNYLDYNKAFRTREDFRAILFKSINILEEGSYTPWIDFNSMIRENDKQIMDHSEAFCLILGLALNLESSLRNS